MTEGPEQHLRWRAALACVIALVLALAGFWVAFDDGAVAGGIPFLGDALNQRIGKAVFGLGACVALVLALLALRSSLRGGGRAGRGRTGRS